MADEPKQYTEAEVEAKVAAEVDGLKRNRDELAKEAKAAKAKLAGYEGIDPERHKQLEADAAEAERKKAAAEGDFKQLETQLVKKYEGEKEVLSGEAKRLRTSMEKYLIDSAAATELAKHSDSPRMLLPHIRSQMKVVEQDGEFHARVVDENGNVRIGNGQGSSPMTLPELIEELKQDKEFAPAFRGTGASGGGASKSNAGSGGSRVVTAGDNSAFIANLEGIAKGTVKVTE